MGLLRRSRGFEFDVSVRYPWGLEAVGAHVWVGPAKREVGFHGVSETVNNIGVARLRWPRDTAPKGGVAIHVSLRDACEVWWETRDLQELPTPHWYGRGEYSESVPRTIHITLQRGDQKSVPHLWIEPTVRYALMHHPKGRLVLTDFDEYCDALRTGLPTSAMVMAGKTIEGTIKLRAQHEGWWDSHWDHLTLRDLLAKQPVVDRFKAGLGQGFLDKLRGSPSLRNPAAHQNWVWTTLSEAIGVSSMVVDLLNSWGGKLPTPDA